MEQLLVAKITPFSFSFFRKQKNLESSRVSEARKINVRKNFFQAKELVFNKRKSFVFEKILAMFSNFFKL